LAGLLWGRGEGKFIELLIPNSVLYLNNWNFLSRPCPLESINNLDFLSESEGDERKLTIFLVCEVAPRAEPKSVVSRPGSFNSFYLNYVFSYVFRLCYFLSSFRSRFALTSEGSTTTSLRQKIEKVCICLHVPLSMLPLPRKVSYTNTNKIQNQKERRERTGSWRLHNR
jgi:hypothetical protein